MPEIYIHVEKRLYLEVVSAVSEFNLGYAEVLKITQTKMRCKMNSLAIAQKRYICRNTQKEQKSYYI